MWVVGVRDTWCGSRTEEIRKIEVRGPVCTCASRKMMSASRHRAAPMSERFLNIMTRCRLCVAASPVPEYVCKQRCYLHDRGVARPHASGSVSGREGIPLRTALGASPGQAWRTLGPEPAWGTSLGHQLGAPASMPRGKHMTSSATDLAWPC